MAHDKDRLFEKIYFLWNGEGEKRNQSIDWYCERYGANIEEFCMWLQGVKHSVKAFADIRRVDNSRRDDTSTSFLRDPLNGDVYIFMNASRNTVWMFQVENQISVIETPVVNWQTSRYLRFRIWR